ncbi:MAG: IS91 family transposase [Steroidobacteraceae bacterium]
MRPALEVADVFRRYGEAFRRDRDAHLGRVERRVMAAIEACRTSALGGHVEQCGDCGLVRPAYNSCRNRHCPKCQGLARAEWLEARQAELLPVPYFHVVFTLPPAAAAIAFQNKRIVYAILFRAAADALRDIAADPRHLGAEIGAVAVLHTWGQALHHHPHLHCIVPGGGLSPDQTRWVACRPGFVLPARVLSRRFRTLFLARLRAAFVAGELHFSGSLGPLAEPARFAECLGELGGKEWVVFAKRPFAGPEQVLAYLGRYTHRVAIANSRLVRLDHGQVSFTWKDYRHNGTTKVMTLAASEFIRRFLLHAVPDGFHRIRHVGFLANGHRTAKLARCRALLAAPTLEPHAPESYRERHCRLTGEALDVCPECGGPMQERGQLRPQPPPRPAFWCDTS